MKLFQTLFALFLTFSLFGQSNNELIRLGDAAMVNGQYTNAVYYYAYTLYKIEKEEDASYYPYEISTNLKAPEKNDQGALTPPKNPTAKEIITIHKLALAYLKSDDYRNSETWFESAIQYPIETDPNARYFYGLTLMYNDKFELAQQQLELFQEENNLPDSKYQKLAADQIVNCQFALNPNNTNNDIRAYLMEGQFNEGSTSFGMQFSKSDAILFSSARIDSIVDPAAKPVENEKYLLDIYQAHLDEDGNYKDAEKFPLIINSPEFHEASAVLSPDGYSMFFTRMNPENKNETEIYVSKKYNNNWMQPLKMDANVNQPGFRSLSPYFSPLDSTLYYASNRPGGLGGLDIWATKINENGETQPPVNLGSQINTISDEFSPFFHLPTMVMYYSSGGHIGFGGQDIFYNKWDPDANTFSEAINAGAPINSSRDDSYFVLNPPQEFGYVTSNRSECTDCDSIYNLKVHCNRLFEIRIPDLEFSINGFVYDKTTNKVLPNARVDFKDVTYAWEHFSIQTDENGYYEHDLIPNLELFMKASLHDYFADKAIISTVNEVESRVFNQDFYLERIPDTEITIEGIEYDFDKATIRPESAIILNKLIEFLELNDNIKIEIRSHTDYRGNDDYNYDLSERRAQSVVDYLIEHGIDFDRLVPQGYGETMPAEIPGPDGEMVTLTFQYIQSIPWENREEAHQRNRRTAFFVLEQK